MSRPPLHTARGDDYAQSYDAGPYGQDQHAQADPL